MRNIIFLILLGILVPSAIAQSTIYQRQINPSLATSQMGSYEVVANVDVSSSDWVCPDSFRILGMCVDSAGAVKIDTKGASAVTVRKPDVFCYPIYVTKIYKVGTDSLLRTNKIEVYGWKTR